MITGVSGRIGSGKDTVGKIIQSIVECKRNDNLKNVIAYTLAYLNNYGLSDRPELVTKLYFNNNWKIKKFADKLKDIVCLLLNCTREQLENREFKEKELGEEWWKYKVHDGSVFRVVTKEYYNSTHKQKLIEKPTPRLFLQLLGTECGRQIIHPNIWVNALMSEYKPTGEFNHIHDATIYPNWIITDMRFPNELKAVKDKGGITIRINRDSEKEYMYSNRAVYNKLKMMGFNFKALTKDDSWSEQAINEGFKYSKSLGKWSFDEDNYREHESETALDNATFDYTIDNNGTIEELIENVKYILEKEKII